MFAPIWTKGNILQQASKLIRTVRLLLVACLASVTLGGCLSFPVNLSSSFAFVVAWDADLAAPVQVVFATQNGRDSVLVPRGNDTEATLFVKSFDNDDTQRLTDPFAYVTKLKIMLGDSMIFDSQAAGGRGRQNPWAISGSGYLTQYTCYVGPPTYQFSVVNASLRPVTVRFSTSTSSNQSLIIQPLKTATLVTVRLPRPLIGPPPADLGAEVETIITALEATDDNGRTLYNAHPPRNHWTFGDGPAFRTKRYTLQVR
jgi:hypothetical protein